MKRTLIITALFLGFSVVGFSQTKERIEVVVTDKLQVSATEQVYKFKDSHTGKDFFSLPVQAQIGIATHANGYISKNDFTITESESNETRVIKICYFGSDGFGMEYGYIEVD